MIILGAGGAGMMCASIAGQQGLRVLLLDHADQVGKKILISGGGRCNFTNTGQVPRILFPPISILRNRLFNGIPRRISSPWWTGTKSPGTKRRSGSCFVTTAPKTSWRCCSRNAERVRWISCLVSLLEPSHMMVHDLRSSLVVKCILHHRW